ncbi:MAG: hypothetical protein KDA57_20035 [Planctomycetales bacterium]|nr:hypothetical protein [Planctomycetales bacterium]
MGNLFRQWRRFLESTALLLMVVFGAVLLGSGTARAGGSDIRDFRSLSAQELLAAEERLQASASGLSSEVASSLASRAVELLLDDKLEPQTSTQTLIRLVELAKPAIQTLNEHQRSRLEKLIDASEQDVSRLAFEDFRFRFTLESALQGPQATRNHQLEEWLSEERIRELTLPELQWCLQQCLPNETSRKEFSVVWTGVLTPPHTGDYTFSVSPINVNRAEPNAVEHSIQVDVGGNRVLDTLRQTAEASQPDEAIRRPHRRDQAPKVAQPWSWQGEPIALVAAQPLPMRVEMKYRSVVRDSAAVPAVLLFWKGPALPRQVIPSQALQGVEQASLQADYRWQANGQEQLRTQPSAKIDFAWSSPATVAPHNPVLVDRLTGRMFELATRAAYLDACQAAQATHLYLEDLAATEYLDSKQRRQFLELLNTSRRELLFQASPEQLLHLYDRFRFGAEELALDALGAWMQAHADLTPTITTNFYRDNRQVYWRLAKLLNQQPEDYQRQFAELYLETEAGHCVLPAAYTLGYRHAAAGTLSEWIALLKTKLDEPSLTSEQRVNWLIARAQAAEINGRPTEYRRLGGERLLSGKDWLVESRLIAENTATQRRITTEFFSRLAAHRMWEEAEAELQNQLSPAEMAAGANKLKQLKAEAESLILAEKRRAAVARIAEFERRRAKAASRGDDASVSRYAAKIQLLEANAAPLLE